MVIVELTRENALDLVIGAKILANGGGGSENAANKLIHKSYDEERSFRITTLDEFKSKEQICIIGMVGGGITKEEQAIVKDLQVITKDPMITAVKNLERYLKIQFKGFVATELGPLNSIVPLVVSSLISEKVGIDGDCCGRSKPQISISTTTIGEIPITPFSITSKYGDELIVGSAVDDIRGEIVARTISKISKGSIGVARCPMRIDQAAKVIIPNTITLAMKLGKKVRKANEEKKDPISAIRSNVPNIQLVMKGTVRNFSRIEKGGFTAGEILVADLESKKQLKIYYKNEYVLTWINGKEFITCPDSLPIVDAKTGLGLTPWENDFEEGKEVVVFARDASEIWRSEKGLKIFGPQVFEPTWTKYIPASEKISTHFSR
ncbi:MAG: DUF917 domain-containing protein [Candidatus Hodarchaeales archaeon]|jgi:DUF917 family protein